MEKLEAVINGLLYIAERSSNLDTEQLAINIVNEYCFTEARNMILLAESLGIVTKDFRNQWPQL